MQTIVQKLTSRKLWMALAAVAVGLAMIFGAEASEITATIGAFSAALAVVVYIFTEAKIDTKAASKKS